MKLFKSIVWACSALLISGSFTTSAGAAPARNECPTAWAPLVQLVVNDLADHPLPAPLLFEGTDGKVFDCLGQNISQDDLRTIEVFSRDIARIISSEEEASEGWNSKICGLGSSDLGPFFHYFFALPYDATTAHSDMCFNRMAEAMERLHAELKANGGG